MLKLKKAFTFLQKLKTTLLSKGRDFLLKQGFEAISSEKGAVGNDILVFIGLVVFIIGAALINFLTSQVFGFILVSIKKLAIFMIPVGLGILAWRIWVHYVQRLYISNMKWVMLQVKVPRDVHKSPEAMEIVANSAFYNTMGTSTWFNKYWEGKVRFWFSLEIVSIDGKVYFFLRVPSFLRNIVESQVYAQYPQAEISEVDDYTEQVPHEYEEKGWSMWGTEFQLTNKDPYPIKTYIDYGMDKASAMEEEQKIDPMTPTLEFLGSLKAGEQVWIQILVKATQSDWADVAKEEIKEIVKKASLKPEDKDKPTMLNLSKGQQETISAIERSVSKLGFDCGIRGIYLAEKDKFNAVNIPGLIGAFRQYNSNTLNGFKLNNPTSFDFPWQDHKGNRSNKLKRELVDAYRRRSFFYLPHASKLVAGRYLKRKSFVLTGEELATIYHFPGKVSETPTFSRIEAKKGEPPSNLPS